MLVRRVALLAALALGLGACGTQGSQPEQLAAVATPAAQSTDTRLADRVLEFGDQFEAVAYHLSFTADARDAQATTLSCTTLLQSHKQLAPDLKRIGAGNLGDVARRLLGASAAVVHACRNPQTIDADIAEIVQLDFGSFRELVFDFSGLTSTRV